MYIDLSTDLMILFRILFAFVLGALLGFEREKHNISSAGIRTYGAISVGACAFGIIGMLIPYADPSRIAAQVVTGIGFLGGGIIFRQGDHIGGLTTAATLWATAAVGLGVGFGLYWFSCVITFLLFCLLYLPRLSWWGRISSK